MTFDATAATVEDWADLYHDPDEAFPQLTAAQIDRATAFGRIESPAVGTVLFARGDIDVDFFLVLDGALEIYQDGADGRPDPFRVHGPGQFSGEMALFNRQKVLVGGRMVVDGRVARLTLPQLRRMMVAEPDIARIVFRAFILRRLTFIRRGLATAVVVGPPAAAGTVRVRRFLDANSYPVTFVDPGAGDRELLERLGVTAETRLPLVIYSDNERLEDPSVRELAERLGLSEAPDLGTVFDLAVVGAGPGGLAAAVYGASEGLQTVVLESEAPGGQAGTSSMIENYLGFPVGVSGQELAARAQVQAQKFGAHLVLPRTVTRLDCDSRIFVLQLDTGEAIQARAVVVATGVHYRRLPLQELSRYEGNGVHYAATPVEAGLCVGEDTVVVGGANSAGQAAIFLASQARQVDMVVRRDSLDATMSRYLQDRIEASSNITVHTRSEVTGLFGTGHLGRVEWTDNRTGESTTREVANVFLMLGAVPNTAWIDGCLETDDNGFICVGPDISDRSHYPAAAFPGDLETSRPGIFAVGDVRSGSVKRVASAVGEGSVVVSAVHRSLASHPR